MKKILSEKNIHKGYFCLDSREVEQIHRASLRVLSEVGILMDDSELFKLLQDNGAIQYKERLLIPIDLVNACLKKCPNQVILKGRNYQMTLGNGDLYIHNLGGARDVLDTPGGNLRPATSRDVATSTILLDALENVTSITPLYTPRDVPAELMAISMFDQVIRNTTKPINGPGVTTVAEVECIAEMARVVLGNHPYISLGVSPVSPLKFSGEIPHVMAEVARQGLAFGPLPCPNVGATSPMSLAGSIVQQNAECLASIVIAQVVHPGLPIVYCGRLSVLNMRSGAPIWGNPEVGMMSAATVQLGHYYGLPVNVYGLAASGFSNDIQSGYERAINAIVPALAGADELSGVGEMAGGIFSSNAQMVIDNDIMGIVRHVRRGFKVNEDTLAVEVIAHAMETTQNFLSEKHTRKYLHEGEIWQGRLGVKEPGWDMWEAAGRPELPARAQVEANHILNTHEVVPLPDDQSKELDKIIASVKRN
jgi:trimethylamine--corrinoid protein Co-methyltransferase